MSFIICVIQTGVDFSADIITLDFIKYKSFDLLIYVVLQRYQL